MPAPDFHPLSAASHGRARGDGREYGPAANGGGDEMIVYEVSDNQACFLQMHLGGDRNFCYLLGDIESGEAAAVDPGFRAARFASAASERGLKIARILITHGHSDHADKAAGLSRITGAPVYAGGGENVPGAEVLNDGELLTLGGKAILALHTPGHTPGHMCYLFGKKLVTGDLLFCGKVGGTGSHFPGSSAEAEWESLQRIMKLPDDVEIFPGHDYYGGKGRMQHSTIGYERRNNPFLLCRSFEDFLNLKDTWEAYKAEHGIR
jgi:glyoxylase-like metal-dependent hydrolase (beta-lactamase superfamily II)